MEKVQANATLIGYRAKATSGLALALIDIKLAALEEVDGRQGPPHVILVDHNNSEETSVRLGPTAMSGETDTRQR